MFSFLVLALAAVGVLLIIKGTLGGLVLIGLAFTLFGLGLRNIPANPPHKGLVTLWGKRQPRVIGEGYTVLAPYFPFFYDVILINMEQHNMDFIFEHLRCNAVAGRDFQSGAAVTVKVGVTWMPNNDANALFNFIGVGTEPGTRNIMRDMLAEALRQYATTKTWEELTRSGDEITQILLQKLTAETASGAAGQQRLRQQGYPDVVGLGIVITRLNVGEIRPEGRVWQVAEDHVAESHEGRAEDYELATEVKQAKKLKDAYAEVGEPRSLDDCLLEIRRRKAIREGHGNIIEIPGLNNLFGNHK
jgi:hypothetical protein